jgi:hypothetical protein
MNTLSIISMQCGFAMVGLILNMKFPGHEWTFGFTFGMITGYLPYLNIVLTNRFKCNEKVE